MTHAGHLYGVLPVVPVGLVRLYYDSGTVTIIQQQLIYRGLEKRGLHSREKKNPDSV